jgi:hypothetical protein
LPWLRKIGSVAFQRAVINATPWKTLHETRDMIDFMHQTSVDIMEEKKRALAIEDGQKLKPFETDNKDLISILRTFLHALPLRWTLM